ncbi:MAG TPA: hypothetical protein VF101_01415 [Gaiellaceae bacterium]
MSRAPLRVLLVLFVATILAATAAAPTAWAWSQTYVSNVNWGPASSKASIYGQITFNYVSFTHPYGGLPQMGTTLCDSTFTSCYAWRWSNTGLITDERNISYGAAACKANPGNGYVVWVNYCATGNG